MELRNYVFYYDSQGRKGSGKSFQSITYPRKRVLLEKIEGKPCQWFRRFLRYELFDFFQISHVHTSDK